MKRLIALVLELESKSDPIVFQRKKKTGSFSSQAYAFEESRRFTLLSFQRPRPHRLNRCCGQQKASDSHQRPSGRNNERSYPLARRLLLVELQASCTLLAEGQGMVADEFLVSTKRFSPWWLSP